MSKDETRFFWNLSGECFAGNKLGDDVTAHFDFEDIKDDKGNVIQKSDIDDKGRVIKGSRLDEFIKVGAIVDKKPDSFEEATDAELNKLRETVKALETKVADLEREAAGIPKNITASRKEVKELKSAAVEKAIEFEELQKQVDELTNPGAK